MSVLLRVPQVLVPLDKRGSSAPETLMTAGNLTSMMSSSNGAPLDALRALSSINSSGIVPAFGQLAQRGAMGGYPASMLQQPGMQQYLTHLPAWMLRMQVMIILSLEPGSCTCPINKHTHDCLASSLPRSSCSTVRVAHTDIGHHHRLFIAH